MNRVRSEFSELLPRESGSGSSMNCEKSVFGAQIDFNVGESTQGIDGGTWLPLTVWSGGPLILGPQQTWSVVSRGHSSGYTDTVSLKTTIGKRFRICGG